MIFIRPTFLKSKIMERTIWLSPYERYSAKCLCGCERYHDGIYLVEIIQQRQHDCVFVCKTKYFYFYTSIN